METRILFFGPVGAGKTQAIRTISDIAPLTTEVRPTDEVAAMKASTTVAMDMGALNLDAEDRIVLYGAPGQDRFDFMWEILLAQSEGVLLLINHNAADPLHDLEHYRLGLRQPNGKSKPLVVGVTHTELQPHRPFSIYQQHLAASRARCGCTICNPPVLALDARVRNDVRAALVTLAAVIEMAQRFPGKACTAGSATARN